MEDCVAKGVKAVSFFTAGFSESGEEDGEKFEVELAQIARRGGIRVLGPNCVVIYCPSALPKSLQAICEDREICGKAGLPVFYSMSGVANAISKFLRYHENGA